MQQEDSLQEERKALGRVLHALHTYQGEAESEVYRWERNFSKLSERHKALLPGYAAKCLAARNAIAANQRFLSSLANNFYEPDLVKGAIEVARRRFEAKLRPSPEDADKVRYILKNVVRDWSEEGTAERSQSYGRICSEIVKRLPTTKDNRPRVLVPGCGLGRLPYDLSQLGYLAEGNEYNYYMLLTSSFLLNHTEDAQQWTIHPWLLSNCNQLSDADQLRAVRVPDVNVRKASPEAGVMVMSAGDFEDVYARPMYEAAYDCVVTCFFLDCAHNIIRFIQLIHRILKPEGLWLNLGPLLYHWADAHTYLPTEELSIELSLEDVERIVRLSGFKTVQRCMVPSSFNTNLRSMLQNSYRTVFWTAQKALLDDGARPESNSSAK